jgi:hypothetical protein
VRWLNRMLDLCHWYLLSARLMLTQHSAALTALNSAASASSNSSKQGGAAAAAAAGEAAVVHYHEPGHASTNPAQPYTPPHQQLTGTAGPISLVRRGMPVRELLQGVAEDCR